VSEQGEVYLEVTVLGAYAKVVAIDRDDGRRGVRDLSGRGRPRRYGASREGCALAQDRSFVKRDVTFGLADVGLYPPSCLC
jgi:hypothetical protein